MICSDLIRSGLQMLSSVDTKGFITDKPAQSLSGKGLTAEKTKKSLDTCGFMLTLKIMSCIDLKKRT